MFITLGRVDRVFDNTQRKVIATSLYGHGQMTCEVLFSNIHVDVGQYLLIIVMDSDSFLRNYAIPIPRDANNVNDFSSIKLYYYNSEIRLEDNRISMFIVDDGNEPYDDSEQTDEETSEQSQEGEEESEQSQEQESEESDEEDSEDDLSPDYYLNRFLSTIRTDKYNDPNSSNYKYDGSKYNYFDRNIHYTHVVLTGSNIEIGRYNKNNPYSTIFIDKTLIKISKYDNQLPSAPVCENAESDSGNEQQGSTQQNTQSSQNTQSTQNEEQEDTQNTNYVVYLRSEVLIDKDMVKVIKIEDESHNPRNEIVLTDNNTSLTYYYKNIARTDFYMDCDHIKMNLYKMEDEQTLTEVIFREDRLNITKYKENGDKNNEIYMDDEKIQLFSFKNGSEGTMFQLKGDEITFKTKAAYKVQSAEVQIDGQPQSSPNPTGGFCQILYCPVTGLPHTTNKLTNPSPINIP